MRRAPIRSLVSILIADLPQTARRFLKGDRRMGVYVENARRPFFNTWLNSSRNHARVPALSPNSSTKGDYACSSKFGENFTAQNLSK
jgi:hypothetical protein